MLFMECYVVQDRMLWVHILVHVYYLSEHEFWVRRSSGEDIVVRLVHHWSASIIYLHIVMWPSVPVVAQPNGTQIVYVNQPLG